jgi:hypothetical protein
MTGFKQAPKYAELQIEKIDRIFNNPEQKFTKRSYGPDDLASGKFEWEEQGENPNFLSAGRPYSGKAPKYYNDINIKREIRLESGEYNFFCFDYDLNL